MEASEKGRKPRDRVRFPHPLANRGGAIKWARTSLLVGAAKEKRRTALDAKSSRHGSDLKSFTEGEEKLFQSASRWLLAPNQELGKVALMYLYQHPNDNRTSRLWMCLPK
jgi:hypothetical protein